jgi:hypothetical protein
MPGNLASDNAALSEARRHRQKASPDVQDRAEPQCSAHVVCLYRRGAHEGSFHSYVEDLRKRKGPDADQPHRIAYKRLVRA